MTCGVSEPRSRLLTCRLLNLGRRALVTTEQIWPDFVQYDGGGAMSVASEYDRAEQVVADVALLQDMAAGRLDEQRVKQAA